MYVLPLSILVRSIFKMSYEIVGEEYCDTKSIWRTIGECIFFEKKWPALWRMIKIAESLLFTDETRNKKITDSGNAIRYFW